MSYLLEDILPTLEKLKAQGKKIVTTNGCFDLLHKGHVTYLNAAKKLGDVLVVGINSDASVQSLKGASRPVTPAADRAFVLLGLKAVDFVFIFEEQRPMGFIAKIKPHIHAKGGDYEAKKLPEYEVLKSLGAEIKIIPFVEGYSTTSILSRI